MNQYIDQIKSLQKALLDYIEDENDDNIEYENANAVERKPGQNENNTYSNDDKLSNLIELFNQQNIYEDVNLLRLFLHLLIQISNNFYRSFSFFTKIGKIIKELEGVIEKIFTNIEIFHIFKSNKRILLFLIEEKILQFNKSIASEIMDEKYQNANYIQYFSRELQYFQKERKSDELPLDFDTNRQKGENDHYICELIRQDLIKEFIIYINKNQCSVNMKIRTSIYETNLFLIENQNPTLIEYAAFFGSIQVFNYLKINQADLKPSLLLYAIHGKNPEIIHSIEECHIEPNISYKKLYEEAVKNHYNELVSYIQDNYIEKECNDYSYLSLKHYNFNLIDDNTIKESNFFTLCKYDYFYFVDFLLKNEKIDVNKRKSKFDEKIVIKEKTDIANQRAVYQDEEKSNTALNMAIEKGNTEIVRLLLSDNNIDVNLINFYKIKDHDIPGYQKHYSDKKTALYIAAENGYDKIVEILLTNNNIDVNTGYEYHRKEVDKFENWNGKKYALNIAIEKEFVEIVRLLLSNNKIDVNLTNRFFSSWGSSGAEFSYVEEIPALIIAIEKENLEIIKLLLSNEKIDVNLPRVYKSDSFQQCSKSNYFDDSFIHKEVWISDEEEDCDCLTKKYEDVYFFFFFK